MFPVCPVLPVSSVGPARLVATYKLSMCLPGSSVDLVGMYHCGRTNNKKKYDDKIVNVKQNIDPQIIKPDDGQKENITFRKIKKEVH